MATTGPLHSIRDRGDLDRLLDEVAAAARPAAARGQVATYLPELAAADPDRFGLAAVAMDGDERTVGDVDVPFALQSIAKVFALALAMQKVDEQDAVAEGLWRRVGREPSGNPFNSLFQLEYERGIPRNPMINAGALVIDDVLLACCEDPYAELHELVSTVAGTAVVVNEKVRREESMASYRNLAMANLMRAFHNVEHEVDEVLDLYNYQCSFELTARQLARAVRFLSNDGVEPATGEPVLAPVLARRLAAIMLTSGTYDAAGEFAFSVGLPCKSGVAGAICALVPHELGVAVWSPPLEPSGNSAAGKVALHEFAERLELSIF